MDEKLTVEIKNTSPIELQDLTESFLSLSNQYKKFALSRPETKLPHEAKLFIKEIKTGSIVADLITYSPLVIPFIAEANTLMAFCDNLKKLYDYFLGKNDSKPEKIDKTDCKELSAIINPVAKDNGSQINLTYHQNAPLQISIHMNSTEANAAQNSISRFVDTLKEPSSFFFNLIGNPFLP
jgi:hypothetical protein